MRRLRESPDGKILNPEQFERFTRAAFGARDPLLRNAAMPKLIDSYQALYSSALGQLWHIASELERTAVPVLDPDLDGGPHSYKVRASTFEEFSRVVHTLGYDEKMARG